MPEEALEKTQASVPLHGGRLSPGRDQGSRLKQVLALVNLTSHIPDFWYLLTSWVHSGVDSGCTYLLAVHYYMVGSQVLTSFVDERRAVQRRVLEYGRLRDVCMIYPRMWVCVAKVCSLVAP